MKVLKKILRKIGVIKSEQIAETPFFVKGDMVGSQSCLYVSYDEDYNGVLDLIREAGPLGEDYDSVVAMTISKYLVEYKQSNRMLSLQSEILKHDYETIIIKDMDHFAILNPSFYNFLTNQEMEIKDLDEYVENLLNNTVDMTFNY